MKQLRVILLEKVDNLGEVGFLFYVKAGYARNFLFPTGKAIIATKKNISRFKNKQSELESKFLQLQMMARVRSEKINALGSIVILSKVGAEGKLFGSVGARDIAIAITNAGVKVSKNEVRVSNKGLRVVGNHTVKIKLYSGIYSSVVVTISSEI
ncbi:50S ribosomal protein L9 [Blochmannia endosymbiont of Colobopsis nipponica]|uniref:50S ribosomal protein L9 n=1 Tax=Blochmannia endosymbiont of Colobopsis nipponica TaxID=2681987 RepID=UPI0017839E0F|nr:50S ribosomal protein L9 [Blochmannia endosymbiont of Colobopsis nipponica]QOI10768.1 50S ribosomal protein L9 [Blochmannia endosymbiont of Colobopsis nipponica]